MVDKTSAIVVWRVEHSLLTIEDLATASGLQPETIETFIRCRLIEPSANTAACPLFANCTVERLQRILQLRYELGVNLAGVSVILDMTEHLEKLQRELELLRERSGLTE
jgi:DNA-binding transcriptional MerR regulator